MAYRYHVGRDLRLADRHDGGVEVEGRARLVPGRLIRLSGLAGTAPTGRLAMVKTWRLMSVDASGPFYRGYCEWVADRTEPTSMTRET
jgi:hypothetical protein